jgi:hypothetical protein
VWFRWPETGNIVSECWILSMARALQGSEKVSLETLMLYTEESRIQDLEGWKLWYTRFENSVQDVVLCSQGPQLGNNSEWPPKLIEELRGG